MKNDVAIVFSKTRQLIIISMLFSLILTHCKDKQQLRIDAWRYQDGLYEKTVVDTVRKESKKFNNPYLKDIIFIDSLVAKLTSSNSRDTIIQIGDVFINRSNVAEVKGSTKSYFLFRGDISGSMLSQNLNFIYDKDLGVIAYYVYGRGYIKLISREVKSRTVAVDTLIFENMIQSQILFPLELPDTTKLYRFLIEDE